jgi:transposase
MQVIIFASVSSSATTCLPQTAAIDAALLKKQYKSLTHQQLVEMMIERDQQVASLQLQLQQKESALKAMLEEAMRKGWQLDEFKQMLFGHKSERFTHYSDTCRQGTLGAMFDSDDIEAVIAASRARSDAEKSLADQQVSLIKTNRHNKRHQRLKGTKRRQYFVEEVIEEVDYSGNKEGLKRCGTKVSVVFDYEPGKIIKKITRYLQYIDADNITYKERVPERIIEKGRVSNRFVANVHVNKFAYSIPYNRQIRMLMHKGASFAPSTVNGWEEICYRKLKRLLRLFKKVITSHDYLQMDEVPVYYVNDVGKGHCSNGYFWVINAPRAKLVLFEFNPSRGSKVAAELLSDFKGKLQCDGFSSYKAAFKDNEEVTLLTCLAHIRRYFVKAKKHNLALVRHFLNETRIIYDIEEYCDRKKMTDDERAAVRKQYIKPILDHVKLWLNENGSAVTPDSPTGKAFTFACNHWDMMYEFVEDGRLLPDNNGAERAIRPIALWRNNSVFAGNEHGAERAALFFSLLETCKLNNINPFEYLCDVYDRIHDCPANKLHELLPNQWKKQ